MEKGDIIVSRLTGYQYTILKIKLKKNLVKINNWSGDKCNHWYSIDMFRPFTLLDRIKEICN